MTPTLTIRIDGDLRDEAKNAARQGKQDLSTWIRDAIREKLGKPDPAATRAAALQVQKLEAEVAALHDRLATLAALAASPDNPAPLSSKADLFESALKAATPDCPISPKELAAASGYSIGHVNSIMPLLEELGAVRKAAWGRYCPAPDADIAAGLVEAKNRLAAQRRVPACRAGSRVPGAPYGAVRERPGSPGVIPSVPDRPAALTAVRERAAGRGLDLRPASQVKRPPVSPGTMMFQEPGAAPVVMQAVPDEVPDPDRKRGRARTARCPHRVPSGSWCKSCGRTI